MNQEAIIAIQKRIGTVPDGFWGPKSIAACQKYLKALMPLPNPWPTTDQAALRKFYGMPGDESRLVKLNVKGLGVLYDGNPLAFFMCHEKVADSLGRIIRALAKSPHSHSLKKLDGCYANRPMRGGSLTSLHARGAAVDFWSGLNGNQVHWPSMALMPFGVMEIFAAEGWTSAGAAWGRDAMHFQATR
jgi:hypothetical protein